ncbi:MAG: hypothetical protein ACK47E_07390 [Cyclobacteriaceae bacterium]|jgi:hypothetical protein
MRKLIDLDEATFKALSKLAIDNNANLKNYIESVLVTHAGGGLKTKTLNKLNSNKKGKN